MKSTYSRIWISPVWQLQERSCIKAIFSVSILAVLVSAQGLAYAQSTNEPPKKPIAQTSCTDHLGMDDVVKLKFIYYTVGHSKRGKPDSATFDVVDIGKMAPVVDEKRMDMN